MSRVNDWNNSNIALYLKLSVFCETFVNVLRLRDWRNKTETVYERKDRSNKLWHTCIVELTYRSPMVKSVQWCGTDLQSDCVPTQTAVVGDKASLNGVSQSPLGLSLALLLTTPAALSQFSSEVGAPSRTANDGCVRGRKRWRLLLLLLQHKVYGTVTTTAAKHVLQVSGDYDTGARQELKALTAGLCESAIGVGGWRLSQCCRATDAPAAATAAASGRRQAKQQLT